MITKRQFIELLQNRLAGGDAVTDVRKQFPLPVISRVLNFVFADVVVNNDIAASDMAIEYEFDVQFDSFGYYVEVYPQPIAGSQSIYTIEDDKTSYNIQDKNLAKAIKTLRGSNKNGAIYFAHKIRFNQQPTGKVRVTQVPNLYQMKDDDILISAESGDTMESKIFQTCMQLLTSPQYQDELNNNNIDAQNARQNN
jgi:hypothetical protein